MRFVRFCALAAAFSVAGLAAAQTAKLDIQVDKPGVKVSPMLYGIFFEEINLAGDGGLYAELIRNRSLEDSAKPQYWTLVQDGSRKGEMTVDSTIPLNPQSPNSLRIRIEESGEGRVGAANAGYWGIPVVEGEVYELSLFARCGNQFQGPITASLESSDGKKVYAKADFAGLGPEWKPFSASLKSSGTDKDARLVLAASKPGSIYLDVVSLFPKKTWKNRPNGLRPDLAEMLAGLRPAFVRFPGGCWVEGDTMDKAQRWKQTIGPIAERRTQPNLWGYQVTNGLGYHEYLQLCEDLGAEPLFVINCGMSHREVVPMEKMGEFVQDALDAIEYANGPADSRWGVLRAKAGHPKPFGLKYLEIGNENGGPAYNDRYALFYKAIKQAYPQMNLIANLWGGRPKESPVEILDEHYYSNPEFYMANANRYDKYDRKGPKIYVGEYAVTQDCGAGNLAGALGEAAFMTGMERNSDVVALASYAPLFTNVKHKRWNPDLINFDNSRCYGLPSYYVQKMFAENRADVVLPLAIETPKVSRGTGSGAVGVGTWLTQAEYKDLKVTGSDGKTLYESDFSKAMKGWRTHGGKWQTVDGALRQTTRDENVRAIVGDKKWTNYTFSLKARKLAGAEGFLVLFSVRNEGAKSWWNIGGWGNKQHGVEIGGIVGNEVPGKIEIGRWYDIRVEVKDANIKCFLDGKLIHDIQRPPVEALYAVAGRHDATGDVVLKVVNVAENPQDAEIRLAGIAAAKRKAAVTVLTSANPTDENTLDEPTKVSPKSMTIELSGTTFRHVFPANSVTVLRVR